MSELLGFKITELYAFIAVAEDGDEGVVGFQTAEGVFLPMFGADMPRINSLLPIAVQIAAKSPGKTIKLARFTNREDTMEIG